ncbi:hypothetical protein [Mycoplasma suis]|nr:hypothetical protein [Mycoplasma suis]
MLLKQVLYVLIPVLGASAPVTVFLLKDSNLANNLSSVFSAGGA